MAIIDRSRTEAIIQNSVQSSIIQALPQESAVLSLMRRLPNLTTKQTTIPVLDMLPVAYWVNGDTGFKQTTQLAWDGVTLTAAELAVIVPIPEAVLDDSDYDIVGQTIPRIQEAFAARIDAAIAFGINRPNEWPVDLLTLARQAGNNVPGPLTYDSLLGIGGVINRVEEAGYMVTGHLASLRTRAALRSLKDDNARPLFIQDLQSRAQYSLDGAPIYFAQNGAFDLTSAQLLSGAFDQAVYAIRQDITIKILDQGVIQDPVSKDILYNLAQQDMIAIRAVMRLGWALPNPVSALNPNRTNVPFAYLEAATPVTTYDATITVTDGTDPIEGAVVNVSGAKKVTGADGVAVFSLTNGNYSAKVSADGFNTQTSTLAVNSAAVTETVALVGV